MKPKGEAEVLVVGGGPVGLYAALWLAGRGIDVQIVDREWRGAARSYALALHPASLELLDEVGLAERVLAAGRRVERIGVYDGRERLGELDLGRTGARYPFVVVLAQDALERILEDGLRQAHQHVLWDHQLTALEPGPQSVRAEIAALDRVSQGYPITRTETVFRRRHQTRAAFVVGADGYHSVTRKALGGRFEDYGGTQAFVVFEFESPAEPAGEVRLVLAERSTNVLWPMRERRVRWSFEVDPAAAPLTPSLDTLAELARERAPWFDGLPREVEWATSTHFERRLVDRFGKGRVWLAGDAAHVTAPAGVQSMNVGLREVRDLGRAIVSILRDSEPMEALDKLDAAQRREWRMLLGQEGLPAPERDAPQWARERAGRLVSVLPASGEPLRALLAQVGLRWGA